MFGVQRCDTADSLVRHMHIYIYIHMKRDTAHQQFNMHALSFRFPCARPTHYMDLHFSFTLCVFCVDASSVNHVASLPVALECHKWTEHSDRRRLNDSFTCMVDARSERRRQDRHSECVCVLDSMAFLSADNFRP